MESKHVTVIIISKAHLLHNKSFDIQNKPVSEKTLAIKDLYMLFQMNWTDNNRFSSPTSKYRNQNIYKTHIKKKMKLNNLM